jgi:hypothetical protein
MKKKFARYTTISQIGAIHTLISKHGLKDDKQSIVKAFTAERTTSVREMSFEEGAALIGHLKSLDPEEIAGDKMRNKVLSMAHEMGWRLPGTEDIDMKHVNNWMRSYSYLKKDLDDYRYKELPRLVTQVEEVYKSFLKKI